MKIKRIALLLLVALFTLLTGCEKIDLSGGKTSEKPTETVKPQDDTVLTVKTSLSGSEAFRPQGSADPRSDRILERISAVEKEFGITIQVETVAADTLAEEFASNTMAGGKYADVVQTNALILTRHYENGTLLSLADAGLTPSKSGVLKTADGVAYALRPDGWMNPPPSASFLLFYNEKIFTDGMTETPLALYEEGYWNWDNFIKLCADVSGLMPGEIFSFAQPTAEDLSLVWGTLHAHGARLFDKDGECIMDSAATRTAFANLKTLISANPLYQLGSPVNPEADATAKLAFLNGHTAFYVGNGAEFFDAAEGSLSDIMREDLRIIGFPAAAQNATGVTFSTQDAFLGVTAAANTDLCKKVLPALFAAEEGDDPKKDLIGEYFYHEEDGALYFDLLKNADTHSLLWADEHTATVEELFFGITNGRSEKEVLLNLQTMFNEGKG